MKRWGNLSSLEEIILTPGQRDDFVQLANLSKLRSVYFLFCQFDFVLKQTMLRAFRNSTIRELALVACDISVIEDGAFDGLSELDVLNLAGNSELSIDNVIDVLSTSEANVSTLILDCVGSHNKLFIAGLHETPSCRRAWTNVNRLSLRGVNLVAIIQPMKDCWPKLQAITLGFNVVFKCGDSSASCWSILVGITSYLQYIDLSYFMFSDPRGLKVISGFMPSSNWIKFNNEYFPSLNLSANCHSGSEFHVSDTCVSMPLRCLTYIKADHLFRLIHVVKRTRCLNISHSNLRYLNISSRSSISNQLITINLKLYGLKKLVVFDASHFGLSFTNFEVFQSLPSLEALNLSGNYLGKSRVQLFPIIPKLADLNLADNHYASFPAEFFANLTSVRRLDLSGNRLTDLLFQLPSTLEYLDVSRNLLTLIEAVGQSQLDQLSGLVLNVRDNPLQCGCPETDFIAWYQTTATQISNRQNITCTQGTSTYKMSEINLSHLYLKCGLTVNTIVLTSSMCGLLVATVVLCLVLYRFRWVIRWHYYKFRYGRRRRRRQDMLLNDLNGDSRYSGYVIYPCEDDQVRDWVRDTLITEVEQNLQKPALYVRERDELIGEHNVDEIVRGIMSSQTALWIVCPEFFRDTYCEIAAHFAFHHLGRRNNLLVILESQFRRYDVPNRFAAMMHPDMGLSRVRFEEDESVRQLFLAKLDAFLPALR